MDNRLLSQESVDTTGSNPAGLTDLELKIVRKQAELFEVSMDIEPTEDYIESLKLDIADIQQNLDELSDKYYRWKSGIFTVDDGSKTAEEKIEIKNSIMKSLSVAILKRSRESYQVKKNLSVAESNLTIMKTEVRVLELHLKRLLEADYDMNS